MAETNERILKIEIPPCYLERDPLDPNWTSKGGLNGWDLIGLPLADAKTPVWHGTIDLSGYARDHKTFYPQGGVVQKGPWWASLESGGVISYTAVSSVPWDDVAVLTQLLVNSPPSFINYGDVGIQQDWTTLLFAESELYVPNINIDPNPYGILQSINMEQSGSLAPTAAQVLYVMKMVVTLNDPLTLAIPASRVILPGTMDQEPELEYMMRLSRSVQLANQV